MNKAANEASAAKYIVIFRACDDLFSVNNNPRPFGLKDKTLLIKICFLSLLEGLRTVPHEIHVLGDRLSDELMRFFRFHTPNVTLGEWGNDESIRQGILLAETFSDEDWVFFCEDDYLHQPTMFTVVDDLIRNRETYLDYRIRPPYMILLLSSFRNNPVVINPADDPNRYLPKKRFLSFLFVSKYSHWRQVSNTTFTFFIQVHTVRKYKKALLKSSIGAKDGMLSRKLYARLWFRDRVLCLSPIHGLSTHLHDCVMSPFVDWEKLFSHYLSLAQSWSEEGSN